MGNGTENGTISNISPTLYWAWRIAVYLTVAIFVVGLPANIFVLTRLVKLMKENFEKFKKGAGLPLFVMTISDIISMFARVLQKTLDYSLPLFINIKKSVGEESWTKYLCKGLIFIPATLTSTTTWIWLVLSAKRYMIIYFTFSNVPRAPHREIALIYTVSIFINIWLIPTHFLAHNAAADTYVCSYDDPDIDGEILTGWLLLARSIWAFFLPLLPILIMDLMILICPPSASTSEDSQINVQGQSTPMQSNNRENIKVLWKWLLIGFIDILLNAPINISRLIYLIFEDRLLVESQTPLAEFYHVFLRSGEVLDYLQYALNPLYLFLFMFAERVRRAPQPVQVNPENAEQNIPLMNMQPGSIRGRSDNEQLREEQLESHND